MLNKEQEKIKKYIFENYEVMEPIFLKELDYEREAMNFLLQKGLLEEFTESVYVIPPEGGFILKKTAIDSTIAVEREFIENKKGERKGFYTGYFLLNRWGLTTQVPSYYIVKTNNFPEDAEEGRPYKFLGKINVILHRAEMPITEENWKELQYKELTRFMKKEEIIKERKNLKEQLKYYLTEEQEEEYYTKYVLNKK